MKEIENRKSWEEFTEKYTEYFKTDNEKWYEKLNELEDYIKVYKKTPSHTSKDKTIKSLVYWLDDQKKNYSKKTQIMKEAEIRKSWEEFKDKYTEYFKTDNEKWYEKLNELEDYIKVNKNTPSSTSKDKTIKNLGSWLSHQKINYKKEVKNMKKVEIRKSWEEFIDKYTEYFKTDNEKWYEKLDELEDYIKVYKKTPSQHSKDKTIKNLGSWLNNQKQKYENEIGNMKDSEIRKSWEEFTEKYKEYFKTDKEIWYDNLNKLEDYIKVYKKTPSQYSKDKTIKFLGNWLNNQKQTYEKEIGNMKDSEIRKSWEEFTQKYKEYFKTDKEIWYDNFNKLKNYIKVYKELPNKRSECNIIKFLGNWVCTQKANYQKEIKIMKEVEIRKAWENFTKEYSEYFTTTKQQKDMSKKEIKPTVKKETTEQKQKRIQPILSQLHKKYKSMKSQKLHKHFEDNPEDWENYHKISEENEESFPDEEIPYKKVINYLEKIPGKKKKEIIDLGCGKARVSEHFQDSDRFKFINMDHVSCNDSVQKQDIKNTELDDYSQDIAILSLAMWGSNKNDYITEVNRILDENGILLIIEPTKRWTDEETGENKLVKLLEENNFTIKNINEEKFMFIECIKN